MHDGIEIPLPKKSCVITVIDKNIYQLGCIEFDEEFFERVENKGIIYLKYDIK